MPVPLPSFDKLDPAIEWSAWKPAPDDPWNARQAAHLYRRLAFGPSREELRNAVDRGLEATLTTLFETPKEGPARKKAITTAPPVSPTTGLPDGHAHANPLRAEWLSRMLSGIEPVREKLALFWHNHFATSVRKINDAGLMEKQNDLLFKHALGSFRQMLADMSRDPAMLIWLDSNQNVKARPNENFAREVMELFSLGVGNYKEKDIQEAARAFSGWHTSGGRYTFNSDQHDGGEKVFLGKKGKLGGDDILSVLMEQPACAKFIVRKLYAFLVNENVTPPDTFLAPLSDAFRKSDYDILVPVRAIARSRHFYSSFAYRQKVKWPVEYVVGLARMVGVGITGRIAISPYSLLGVLELMGQPLFSPPNVKGWEGGKSWLNTATVLARHNFAYEMANGMKDLNAAAAKLTGASFMPAIDPLAFVLRQGINDPEQIVQFYGKLLFPGDFRPELREKLIAYIGDADPDSQTFVQRCRDTLYAMLSLPEYQLN